MPTFLDHGCCFKMKNRFLALAAVGFGAYLLFALGWSKPLSLVEASATTDPCFSDTLKSSVAITSSSSDLVAPLTGENVYVCGFGFGASSTGGSARLGAETTAGQCASNTDSPLTGNMGLSSSSPLIVGGVRQTILSTAAGAGLCVGGSGSGTGYVTYIQK